MDISFTKREKKNERRNRARPEDSFPSYLQKTNRYLLIFENRLCYGKREENTNSVTWY